MGTAPAVDARRRLVFPLDYPTLKEARAAAEIVAPAVGVLKVGLFPTAPVSGRRRERAEVDEGEGLWASHVL